MNLFDENTGVSSRNTPMKRGFWSEQKRRKPVAEDIRKPAKIITETRLVNPGEVEILTKRLQLEERRRLDAELSAKDALVLTRKLRDTETVLFEKDRCISELHKKLETTLSTFANLAETTTSTRKKKPAITLSTESTNIEMISSNKLVEITTQSRGFESALELQRRTTETLQDALSISGKEIVQLRRHLDQSKKELCVHLTEKAELNSRVIKLEKKMRHQWDTEDELRQEINKMGDVLVDREHDELNSHFDLLNRVSLISTSIEKKAEARIACTEIVYGIVIDALDRCYQRQTSHHHTSFTDRVLNVSHSPPSSSSRFNGSPNTRSLWAREPPIARLNSMSPPERSKSTYYH